MTEGFRRFDENPFCHADFSYIVQHGRHTYGLTQFRRQPHFSGNLKRKPCDIFSMKTGPCTAHFNQRYQGCDHVLIGIFLMSERFLQLLAFLAYRRSLLQNPLLQVAVPVLEFLILLRYQLLQSLVLLAQAVIFN